MLRRPAHALCLTLTLIALALVRKDAAAADEPETETAVPLFETQIRPLLERRCFECHGEKQHKAELNLTTRGGLLKGGESGAAIEPGDRDASLLFEYVRDGDMPPDDAEPLSEEEVALIGRWIDAGAPARITSDGGPPALTQDDVIPLMDRRCTCCHGHVYQRGGLDLRTPAAMLTGGDSGPAVIPGDPEASLLVQRVRERQCPPKDDLGEAGIEPMTEAELATVQKWIALGAPQVDDEPEFIPDGNDPLVSDADRRFWSFQPPQRPHIPSVQHAELVSNPIDAFLLARLEEHGLSSAGEADRLTLLRRATFDLTGLPPTPEQVAAWLQDDGPTAWDELIDRLLDSPQYGEHWARFWLDLAGYSDSEGKRNADLVRPYAWRYRDYVIRSFNADKPFNQFLVEQIAGDELVDYAGLDAPTPDDVDKLVATGFLRMAPDGTSADPVNRLSDRIEVIADEIDILSRGVLGLTMKCARCHSHKYDPIPQRDYYRFVALFRGAYDEYDWMTPQPFGNQWKDAQQRFLTVVLPEERRETEDHNAPIHEQIAALQGELDDADVEADRKKKMKAEIKDLESKLRELPKIRALWDRGEPSPTYIYQRGDEMQPSRLVEPGVPSALVGDWASFEISPPEHSSAKTGRRLALARWLTNPHHPLTARVFVNRIWQQHFGDGIVRSIDNFGQLGTPPTHPRLLDWLAVEFVENGWSLKDLHRTIMTSRAYRQSSTVTEQQQTTDPENSLFSRMPMRRLSAEELRDALLMIAGRLEERPFGPPDPVDIRKDGLVTAAASGSGWRRSIYLRQRRKEMPTLLETFDLPQMNPNCTRRQDSTVVSQPLYLLNNGVIHDLAGDFARRVAEEAGDEPGDRVDRAWLLAFGRPITNAERNVSLAGLEQLTADWQTQLADSPDESGPSPADRALADFCHTLINSADFLYVD